jgi:hypothetical protein
MTGLKIYGNDAGVKEGEGKEIITERGIISLPTNMV